MRRAACLLFVLALGCEPVVEPRPPTAPTIEPPPPAVAPTVEVAPPPATVAPAEELPAVSVDGDRVTPPKPVAFQGPTDRLAPESEVGLDALKRYLDATGSRLRIEARATVKGPPKGSEKLAGARAVAIARWLVGQGVDCKRLAPSGVVGEDALTFARASEVDKPASDAVDPCR